MCCLHTQFKCASSQTVCGSSGKWDSCFQRTVADPYQFDAATTNGVVCYDPYFNTTATVILINDGGTINTHNVTITIEYTPDSNSSKSHQISYYFQVVEDGDYFSLCGASYCRWNNVPIASTYLYQEISNDLSGFTTLTVEIVNAITAVGVNEIATFKWKLFCYDNPPPTPAPVSPVVTPTSNPTILPTNPSISPSQLPTNIPTLNPTMIPSSKPTTSPTTLPTTLPTISPTTFSPSKHPTDIPSGPPSGNPTGSPEYDPFSSTLATSRVSTTHRATTTQLSTVIQTSVAIVTTNPPTSRVSFTTETTIETHIPTTSVNSFSTTDESSDIVPTKESTQISTQIEALTTETEDTRQTNMTITHTYSLSSDTSTVETQSPTLLNSDNSGDTDESIVDILIYAGGGLVLGIIISIACFVIILKRKNSVKQNVTSTNSTNHVKSISMHSLKIESNQEQNNINNSNKNNIDVLEMELNGKNVKNLNVIGETCVTVEGEANDKSPEGGVLDGEHAHLMNLDSLEGGKHVVQLNHKEFDHDSDNPVKIKYTDDVAIANGGVVEHDNAPSSDRNSDDSDTNSYEDMYTYDVQKCHDETTKGDS